MQVGNLLNGSADNSKILQPRAEFGVLVRAKSGSITDWFLMVSVDKTNWVKVHTDAFTATNAFKVFQLPQNMFYQLQGTTADVEATAGYCANAKTSQIKIEKDILE